MLISISFYFSEDLYSTRGPVNKLSFKLKKVRREKKRKKERMEKLELEFFYE